jgi:hypothetical protein
MVKIPGKDPISNCKITSNGRVFSNEGRTGFTIIVLHQAEQNSWRGSSFEKSVNIRGGHF